MWIVAFFRSIRDSSCIRCIYALVSFFLTVLRKRTLPWGPSGTVHYLEPDASIPIRILGRQRHPKGSAFNEISTRAEDFVSTREHTATRIVSRPAVQGDADAGAGAVQASLDIADEAAAAAAGAEDDLDEAGVGAWVAAAEVGGVLEGRRNRRGKTVDQGGGVMKTVRVGGSSLEFIHDNTFFGSEYQVHAVEAADAPYVSGEGEDGYDGYKGPPVLLFRKLRDQTLAEGAAAGSEVWHVKSRPAGISQTVVIPPGATHIDNPFFEGDVGVAAYFLSVFVPYLVQISTTGPWDL